MRRRVTVIKRFAARTVLALCAVAPAVFFSGCTTSGDLPGEVPDQGVQMQLVTYGKPEGLSVATNGLRSAASRREG